MTKTKTDSTKVYMTKANTNKFQHKMVCKDNCWCTAPSLKDSTLRWFISTISSFTFIPLKIDLSTTNPQRFRVSNKSSLTCVSVNIPMCNIDKNTLLRIVLIYEQWWNFSYLILKLSCLYDTKIVSNNAPEKT